MKEGDRVLFTSYAGNEVSIDGEEYLIMTEDDITASCIVDLNSTVRRINDPRLSAVGFITHAPAIGSDMSHPTSRRSALP